LDKRLFASLVVVLNLLLLMNSVFAQTQSLDTFSTLEEEIILLERNEISNIGSNRYTKPEKGQVVVINRMDLDGYEKILEDDYIEVYYWDKNASIRVLNKVNGYIWGGLPSEKPSDMNVTWSGIGNSLVSIDYYDQAGIERKTSIAANNVKREYVVNGNTIFFSVNFTQLGISFDFSVELNDGSLIFRLDSDSIQETGKYMLGSVYFVPFFGSVRADEIDGYIFIPDGPGALIRFDKPFKYLSNFEKRVYGKDFAIDHLFEVNDLKVSRPNDFATEEKSVLMPIFGVVHGPKQNGLFARITSGEEYAAIVATPAGVLTNYNWVSAKFIYRQKYLQPTTRSGAGVQIVQQNRNHFDPEIRYYFLSGDDADYVGMAKVYRNMLYEEGVLARQERIDSQIPLKIAILVSDIEKGFIFNSLKVITSLKQAEEIVTSLNSEDISNLTVVMKGWQEGGLNGSKVSKFAFEEKLGEKDAFLEFSDFVDQQGGRFYFYENPVAVNQFQIDLRKEGGHSLSQDLIKIQRDNDYIWIKDTYLVKINLVADYLENKAELYKSNGMKNMAVDEVGFKLYAENQRGDVVTRDQARVMLEETAKNIVNNLENLALYTPNQYFWRYSSEIFHLPMVNSQYIYETDTVPFIQIVLKGSIDYYAPYSNMGFYSPTDILRLIEYGAYPSFVLTALTNDELKYTAISDSYYSTYYEHWLDVIVSTYNTINNVLSKFEGKQIVDRTVLKEGVVKVDYEGDVSIIVNYTNYDYFFENDVVPALGYLIV